MRKMKSLHVHFALFVLCSATGQVFELYKFAGVGPTKIGNVDNLSKLYLASSDDAQVLSQITITSNGQTKTLDQLQANVDANGFQNGFPVNSDLTISTANSQDTTVNLSGILFVSSPDMAKDPNFLVYVVADQVRTVDRSKNDETTLVLLNVRNTSRAPYYNTRVESINQPSSTNLLVYHGVPEDGYTDPKFQETSRQLIFQNPVITYFTGTISSMFFDHIEPIQYTLRTWHIRAIGGISFKVSQQWVDMSTYQTTAATTTGYTMSQSVSNNSTVNFKYTENAGDGGMFGFMINTADKQTDMNVTSCYNTDCITEKFVQTMPVYTDIFQYPKNYTTLYMDHTNTNEGIFYLQYCRSEAAVGVSSTTPASMETTTKTSATISLHILLIISLISMISILV